MAFRVLGVGLVALLAGVAAAGSTAVAMRLADGQAGALRAAQAEARPALRDESLESAQPADAVMKSADGHYWADGDVDGRTVRFLVDTGATEVALTPQDAERLGLDLAKLQYGSNVVTAAGRARAASVKLASVTIAGARLNDVDALVIEKGLDASLLGMSYLGRLSSFEATRQTLVLRP